MADIVFSVEDLMLMADVFKVNGDQMRNQLISLRNSLDANIIHQTEWLGRAAIAAHNIVTHDHKPMIKALENAYFKIGTKTRDLNTAFRNQMNETADNAVYHQGALNVFEQAMRDAYDETEQINAEFSQIYNRISDTMSFSMPSNNAFQTDWQESVRLLAETQRRLVEFRFDLDDVEELIDQIERYVGKIEDATTSGTSPQDREPVTSVDFRNAMREMHESIGAYEVARVDELLASWLGRHPYEILYELPQPMTSAEQAAWERYVLSVIQGLSFNMGLGSAESEYAMKSFWSHFPASAGVKGVAEVTQWLITAPMVATSELFIEFSKLMSSAADLADTLFFKKTANWLQDGADVVNIYGKNIGKAAKWIKGVAFPILAGIIAGGTDFYKHGEVGMALAHGGTQFGWAYGNTAFKTWLGKKVTITVPGGIILVGIYIGGSMVIKHIFDRESDNGIEPIDWEGLEELWDTIRVGQAFSPAQ